LLDAKIRVPAPILVTLPLPEMLLPAVASEAWSKVTLALSVMLPRRLAAVPCSVPALTVVPPS